MKINALRRDEKGASALEFALAAPAMMMFIVGIGQLGMLCMADAGLSTAVAEGARAAAVYVPDEEDDEREARIQARIAEAAWGMQDQYLEDPEIVHDKDADERKYVDISMTYSAPLDFIFLDLGPVELSETRRVYLQGITGAPATSSTTSASSSASTSSTTSASSSTSSGADTSSASSTSASSSSTSSTSSTSTSSGTTTSTSSGTTTSTSSGDGHDHGNSNGNSNGNNSSNGGSTGGSNGGSNGNSNGNR